MEKSIIDLLEKTVTRYPDKTAFTNGESKITYAELLNKAKKIGTAISEYGFMRSPVVIYIDKSIECIAAMLGVVYSGNHYVIIDTSMPVKRYESICKVLKPRVILYSETSGVRADSEVCSTAEYIDIDQCDSVQIYEDRLEYIRERMIDADVLYVLFTSGSTGVPKGVVVTHRNVISYTEWVCDTFDINESTIFGSQTPFYFSMSVTDIFSTIRTGATFVIIPRHLFTFPVKALEFVRDNDVNTIYWVPSALCIFANWKALDYVEIPKLKKILFAGEVMPTHQLNIWMEHFKDAMFANLFGPTETTDICSYYIVNRRLADNETVPIGRACDNCDLLIVDENGKEAAYGEQGELYVRGSFVAAGYYDNPDSNREAFVQNPLNCFFPEIVYRTGDIVRYNESGELIYLGRRDHQIKHMGYRIELGEVENAINSIEGVMVSCCVFDDVGDRIIAIYEGKDVDTEEVIKSIGDSVPEYMCPNEVIKLDKIPLNSNGKIDRKLLKKNYIG